MKRKALNFTLYVNLGLLIVALILPGVSLANQKLTAEEIVAKHLQSIAADETRASVESIIAGGSVVASYRAPTPAQFSGQGVIASQGNKSVIGMNFPSVSNSQENLGFDGETVTVGYARPGARSNLGDFILTHKDIVKNGLMGGTLSSAWPLLKLDKKQKLETGGTKKIGERNAYEIKFYPRSGSDVQIAMFFDTETFQHLRTEYTRIITAQLGASINESAGQRSTRYQLIEDFGNYKKEGALVLPHSYKISLQLDSRGGTFAASWDWTLDQFAYNQPIQPGTFNVNKQ